MSDFGKTIRIAAEKLNQDIDVGIIEQLMSLVRLGIIKIYSDRPRVEFNIDNTHATLHSMVGVKFEGKEKIVELEEKLSAAIEILKFYANRDNYDREGVCEHNGSSTDYKGDWWVDYGFHASEFLKKIGVIK